MKKNDAVNSWTISIADKYPSDNSAILLSVSPNIQERIPNSQMPFWSMGKNAETSEFCCLFINLALVCEKFD